MKIAITGHTRGLGAEITKIFQANNHEVVGFSRRNGWDIRKQDVRKKLIETLEKENFDCFINNAYPYSNYKNMDGFAQVDLLNEAWLLWEKKEDRVIVTIGSHSAETVKNYYHPYSVHKKAIDDTCKQLRNCRQWPHVINVKPEYIDTDIVKHINAKKMAAVDVAELVYTVVTHKLKIYDIMFSAR